MKSLTNCRTPPTPSGGFAPVSRRTLLGGVGGMAGAAGFLPMTEVAAAADADASADAMVAAGVVPQWVSVTDFGAMGDGETDDQPAIQAALDWAGERPGTALHLPARIFALGAPLLVPEDVELAGQLPGSGNRPLCGFRALPGFKSDLVQNFQAKDAMQSVDVAALLVCKEWTTNAEFAGRLHIRDLFFDVNALKDARGAPIHGLLLSNQQLDLHNVWVRHPTGYGVWINTQRPDGVFVKPIVDNVLRRVWVRGAGIGNLTYETDHGVHRYGAFLIGAMPGARDPDGQAEPALATDGIMDYCTVAVGPEEGLGCRGDGIHITQASGWRLTACHINGAGRHGIMLRKAYQTEVTGTYLDGWGLDAEENEGDFGGIWCTSIISLEEGAEGCLLVTSNRVRARGVRSQKGNRFAAIGLRAGTVGTPRGVVATNVISRRRDAEHRLSAFDFGRGGSGELEAVVVGNIVTGVQRVFLRHWDQAAIRPHFSGNNFQYRTAPPDGGGWFPAGLHIENTAPTAGGWCGWVNVAAGEPGTWKSISAIES